MAPDRDDDEYEEGDPSLMMPDTGASDDDDAVGGKSGSTDSDMSKGVGGQREVFLGREKKGSQWNAGRELMEIKPEPSHYLARSIFSDQELARNIRIKARHNRVTKGYTDLAEIQAMWHIGRVGVDGRGMQNAVSIATGMQKREERMQGFGAMADAMGGMDNGKPDSPMNKGG